jgi:hypothetical protein
MIPNHPSFIEAIEERKKVSVRFYSNADHGVLIRVCAPVKYGPVPESKDGLNLYWFWNYASDSDSHILSLASEQILDLHVLGEIFDPKELPEAVWDPGSKEPAQA